LNFSIDCAQANLRCPNKAPQPPQVCCAQLLDRVPVRIATLPDNAAETRLLPLAGRDGDAWRSINEKAAWKGGFFVDACNGAENIRW
jgi:hypothetical protein